MSRILYISSNIFLGKDVLECSQRLRLGRHY